MSPPLQVRSIRGTAPCPICQCLTAHHVDCPARLSGAPRGDVVDRGEVVARERHPKSWTQWERADGATAIWGSVLGPLPTAPPRGTRSWSRWRLRERALVISGLDWLCVDGAFCWQHHLSVMLRRGEVTRVLSDFDLLAATEDSAPGSPAREFWRGMT